MTEDNKFYLEDVDHVSSDIIKIIEEHLKDFGLDMTEDKKDIFYEILYTELEMMSNGEHKNEN
jgi:uncharacterized membrane protein YqjE